MHKPQSLISGFTLVELLVTLGIMVGMVAVTIPSFRQVDARREVAHQAEFLRQALYETRSLALAPAADKTTGSDGYELRFLSGREYGIFERDVRDTSGKVVASGKTIRTVVVPTGIDIVPPGAVTAMTYLIADQGRLSDPEPPDGRVTIVVSDNRLATTLKLVVSTVTGQVEVAND